MISRSTVVENHCTGRDVHEVIVSPYVFICTERVLNRTDPDGDSAM